MFDVILIKDQLEAWSYVATILGIFVAFVVFLFERRKTQRAQEAEAYFRTNDRQIQYLILCLEHMDADAFDPDTKTTGVATKRAILFSVLLNTFEIGYLSMRKASSRALVRQWRGWENYIRMWMADEDFRQIWKVVGPDFDEGFQEYMNAQAPRSAPRREIDSDRAVEVGSSTPTERAVEARLASAADPATAPRQQANNSVMRTPASPAPGMSGALAGPPPKRCRPNSP